jgi:hypothetical protein
MRMGMLLGTLLWCIAAVYLTGCTASLSFYPVDQIDHRQQWEDSGKRK